MKKTRVREVNLTAVLVNLIPRVCLTPKGKTNGLNFFVFPNLPIFVNDVWSLLF